MITMENIRLGIDGKDVLNGIDLHLESGDIYGLLGPNGAGKSTTIYALLGLRPYSGGHVRILGGDPAEDPIPIRRQVGVMPEKAGFYEWMTAPDYLGWYAHLYGFEPAAGELDALLDRVGLGAKKGNPVATYSRGMRQRLAVARALLPHPRLLILDEPTNGLDPKGRREVHDLLVEYARTNEAGVLLCTHLLDDVDRLCNRIGIIEGGRTRIEGAIGELLSQTGRELNHRLRLEAEPDVSDLPDGITVLDNENGWWRVRTRSGDVAGLWGELWRRGWRIQEIRSEASNLEALYMRHTGRNEPSAQEVTQ
ncbi:ABC transporter ATP-binding protein [Pseudodesulfovibrio methanolicus]|uniref:ABC transporter ATP-binding protein n=1 Tax=Pseudodesulfovibrio methanolicus TaxID=3126690 RepID=A0ABZ2J1B9_9BACT